MHLVKYSGSGCGCVSHVARLTTLHVYLLCVCLRCGCRYWQAGHRRECDEKSWPAVALI
jgi:hypothetical protein